MVLAAWFSGYFLVNRLPHLVVLCVKSRLQLLVHESALPILNHVSKSRFYMGHFRITLLVSWAFLDYLLHILSAYCLNLQLAEGQTFSQYLLLCLLMLLILFCFTWCVLILKMWSWCRRSTQVRLGLFFFARFELLLTQLLLPLFFLLLLRLFDAGIGFVIDSLGISELVAHHVEVRLHRIQKLNDFLFTLLGISVLIFFITDI